MLGTLGTVQLCYRFQICNQLVNGLVKEPMEESKDGLPMSHLGADLPWSMLKQVRGSICVLIVLVSISYRYEYNNLFVPQRESYNGHSACRKGPSCHKNMIV